MLCHRTQGKMMRLWKDVISGMCNNFYWTALWMNEHMIIIHKSLLTPRKIETLSHPLWNGWSNYMRHTHTHVIRFGLFHSDQLRLTEQIHTRPMLSCRSVFLSAWCLWMYEYTGKIYNQIRNRFNLAPSLLSFFSILSHWPYFRFMVGSFDVMKNFEESRNFSFGLAKRQQKKRGPLTKRKPRFFGWSWWCIKSTDGREREKTHTSSEIIYYQSPTNI